VSFAYATLQVGTGAMSEMVRAKRQDLTPRPLNGSSLEEEMSLATRDHASHGGSFPIQLTGGACVGVVTVSGLPQREDHALVVEVLAGVCGIDLAAVGLN
jgi:uncharacterized protein (UPF0303 family)